ncbi:MAG: hypothetical protein QW724_01315 [Nitrososphaerota archaeon]
MRSVSLSDEEIISEAIKIVEVAEKKEIILRTLGALAIRIHPRGLEDAYKFSERSTITRYK